MSTEPTEVELRKRLDRALRLEAAVLSLARVDDHEYLSRVEHILRVDARNLGIARVSYWSFRADQAAIHCDSLYLGREDRFESGLMLHERDYRAYFDAMRRGEPIVARDAHTHPATMGFSASYLKPLGIGAMLDVPVYVRGSLLGVVCHEHVGEARDFAEDEQMFAVAIAQQMALAIEARRREAAEEQVRRSAARFGSMVEASPIPTVVTALADGTCLYGNEALSQISGVPLKDILGKRSIDFYVDPEQRRAVLDELEARGRVVGREIEFKRADGSRYWALLSMVKIDFGGEPAIIASFHDLTPQKELEEKLRVMALHDPLTGLANRALLLDRLNNEVARANRDHEYRFGVLYIDLDGFKAINDRYGHVAGDRVLAEVAARIASCLRATDTAGRTGGDEFVVLLAGIADLDEAMVASRRVTDALSAPVRVGDVDIVPAGSVGVAVGSAGRDPQEILRQADAAMYEVKQRRGARA